MWCSQHVLASWWLCNTTDADTRLTTEDRWTSAKISCLLLSMHKYEEKRIETLINRCLACLNAAQENESQIGSKTICNVEREVWSGVEASRQTSNEQLILPARKRGKVSRCFFFLFSHTPKCVFRDHFSLRSTLLVVWPKARRKGDEKVAKQRSMTSG